MRYHYKKPLRTASLYGKIYQCNHPVYFYCTLFMIGDKGLAVIQQQFSRVKKITWWDELDTGLPDELYLHPNFKKYFDDRAGNCKDGLYPTVTIRQIMWALKMKPLRKERLETVFDRKDI